MPDAPEPLFTPIVVHCFFAARCRHTETGFGPAAVYDAMEAHYRAVHQADIGALTGPVTVPVIRGAWWVMR